MWVWSSEKSELAVQYIDESSEAKCQVKLWARVRSPREKECNEQKKARMLIEEHHYSRLLVRWSKNDPYETHGTRRAREGRKLEARRI